MEVTNDYYNIEDNMKPYILLLMSVLGEDKDLWPKEEENNYTVLIVFIFLISAFVIGFITLALFMIVIKKRNQKSNVAEDENEMSPKLYSNNLSSKVDP